MCHPPCSLAIHSTHCNAASLSLAPHSAPSRSCRAHARAPRPCRGAARRDQRTQLTDLLLRLCAPPLLLFQRGLQALDAPQRHLSQVAAVGPDGAEGREFARTAACRAAPSVARGAGRGHRGAAAAQAGADLCKFRDIRAAAAGKAPQRGAGARQYIGDARRPALARGLGTGRQGWGDTVRERVLLAQRRSHSSHA